jgi:hypothetical protein
LSRRARGVECKATARSRSTILNGLVHLLDKVRSNRDVVVLRADLVTLLCENVGDLARNGRFRAPTAQKEVELSVHRTTHLALATPYAKDVDANSTSVCQLQECRVWYVFLSVGLPTT